MEITEINEIGSLDDFKASVWPVADLEHYGVDQPIFLNKSVTFIAKENNEVFGYGTIIIDSGVAQLEPLMVSTKGKGIGTKLLYALESKAKEFGVHKVWLETGTDWKAKSFYEKHGYMVRTVLPNHTGGKEFVLMDKMI